MARRQEEARDELIQRVVALVREKLDPKEAALVSEFVKQYYLSAAPEDLLERNIIDLYGALISHWHFIHQRHPNEVKIRVYNPQFEQHGWQSTHTVIEIVDDYKPFLIESVRMVLNRKGLNVHLILHLSKLKVERNEEGIVTQVKSGKNNSDADGNVTSEIPIFIEIDRQSDPEVLEELRVAIADAIDDVHLTVSDWRNMTETMEMVISGLEKN